jgi:hypothetical protein
MAISIVQAARASMPYSWAKFARWMAEQGLDPQEYQTMLENGAEPSAIVILGTLDESVVYPGLPALDGLTLEAEPQATHL